MHESPNPPQPVLDYAPGPPPSPAVQRALVATFVLACIIGGAAFQYRIQPLRYTAVGYMSIQTPPPAAPVASIQPQQKAHAAGITAIAPATILSFRAAGFSVSPQELQTDLRVTPIPQSSLVSVAFTSENPAKSARVANLIMNAYLAKTPGIALAVPAVQPPPNRNFLYPVSGAAAGALIAVTLLLLRQRSLRRQRRI